MSHLKERPEKNCLNCNAEIHGTYCHICGQENLEPAESVWHLVTHFFNDITHFDGKFFSTLKYLIFNPGFLSLEYKAGRRANYLNPVRMYVFTSAIFFLIFFSLTHIGEDILKRSYNGKAIDQISKMDSLEFDEFTREINNGKPFTRADFKHYIDTLDKHGGIHFTTAQYSGKPAYDSLLRSGKIHDNWFERTMVYKEIQINEKYKNDPGQIFQIFVTNLLHSFPQMLFISLPLFALILKLLYIRRKQFYYASHAIFSIHLYVFVFIMILGIIALQRLHDRLLWSVFNYLTGIIVVYIFYYQYKSMRNFYQQRRAKTIWKYILLNMSMLIVIILLFTVFVFTSLLKI